MVQVAKKSSATVSQISKRILEREDNPYKKDNIYHVLNMFMDEMKKALLDGEPVLLTGLGTIIPEVKTYRNCYLPRCNNETHENAPYTRLKFKRSMVFKKDMNDKLMDNIENGIYGLEYTPFGKQQLDILKENGYISDDAEYQED